MSKLDFIISKSMAVDFHCNCCQDFFTREHVQSRYSTLPIPYSIPDGCTVYVLYEIMLSMVLCVRTCSARDALNYWGLESDTDTRQTRTRGPTHNPFNYQAGDNNQFLPAAKNPQLSVESSQFLFENCVRFDCGWWSPGRDNVSILT